MWDGPSSITFLVLISYWHLIDSTKRFEITMPDVSPKKEEAYLCTSKALPRGDLYAVKFEPLADEETAHHMIVSACQQPGHLFKNYWDCTNKDPCKGEETIIYAWAKNAPALVLPKHVGFKVGDETNLKYLVIQVHYARPLADDEVDGSGVSILLTQTPQKFTAGIYLFESSSFIIPPKSIGIHVDIACSYSGSPMMPFAFRTHAHDRGRSISAYRIRDEEWTQIGIESPQKPQAFYPIARKKRIVVKKGDYLAARCTFDSPNSTEAIYPGAFSANEMCNFYLMAYTVNKHRATEPIPEGCHQTISKLPFPKDSYFPKPLGTVPTVGPEEKVTLNTIAHLATNPLPHISTKTPSTSVPDLKSVFQQKPTPKQQQTTVKHYVLPHKTSTHAPKIQTEIHINVNQPQPIIDTDWHLDDTLKQSIGQVCGLAIDKDKHVVLLHRADRVWGYNTFDEEDFYLGPKDPISQHTILHLDGITGKVKRALGNNLFFLPHGLTIDHKGNYWITDVGAHQVMKFTADNTTEPVLTLGVQRVPGKDDQHFCKPTDVAVDMNGNFYVADGYCNSRIMKFSPEGKLLHKWGQSNQNWPPGPGEFSLPHSLTMNHEKNYLYVCDRENSRIQVFDINGTFIQLISHKEFGNSLYAITYNPAYGGIIYAVNGKDTNGYATGFTISANTGKILNSWNAGKKHFKNPHDVVVTENNNVAYVAEINPNTVWKFQINNPHMTSKLKGKFPWKVVEPKNTSTIFNDTDNSEVDIVSVEDDVSMLPAIVVVIVLATPIVLVLMAAIIQHLRFKHARKKAVKSLRKNPMRDRHLELCFGCCATPRYYYDGNRGFDKLVKEHSDISSTDDEEDLFTRKA